MNEHVNNPKAMINTEEAIKSLLNDKKSIPEAGSISDLDASMFENKLLKISNDRPISGSKTKSSCKKRCKVCNKKVGLVSIPCKCDGIFCPTHRADTEHDCEYDYTTAKATILAEGMDVVSTDKVNGRI